MARWRNGRASSSRLSSDPRRGGHDFHLEVKLSTSEHANVAPLARQREHDRGLGAGLPLARGCRRRRDPRLLGQTFPHPEVPASESAVEDMVRSYDVMLLSG